MKAWSTSYIPPLENRSLPTLKLYNSVSRQIEEISEANLSMYVCGITPYDATHLGHAATYLSFDLIHRYSLATDKSVSYIQNITDVDDPLLERATRDHVSWANLAESQIALFRDDMTALRVLPPQHYLGAVETIPWVIEAIASLEKRGAIYRVEDDLYFDISSDGSFKSNSTLSVEEQKLIFAERGGDPDRSGKRNPLDCLIWRAHREGEPSWPSPYGPGRPGWHIECTAIALKYLTAPISIQGGGSDLHFPHHSMCAAQGRVLAGADFARRFVHTGMIGLNGEKMSKSRGNLKFVSVMRDEGIDPMLLRIALLSGHYRADREWSDRLLSESELRLNLWREAFSSPYGGHVEGLIMNISAAISDDLNTPKAFALIDEWAKNRIHSLVHAESSDSVNAIGQLSRYLDGVLGIAL
ncbi:MAG: cysteine--1-D-myo-inosityl 2-amino-2-deoxy-alpha-D-glucopyranoside ligase [Actinobacteria bacterium]|nr:cysteine--1-D-myo-inosityl 2-amino-2-deoxy-alpha-D-glucopyranoside ligase [Actinomycetota bacterium]